MNYPVAEEFHSIQGEGNWTGTAMKFIRLAGCTVGRPKIHSLWDEGEDVELPSQGPVRYSSPADPFPLVTGRKPWLCHTYDGRPFWCDTDFNKSYSKTETELLEDVYEQHICVSGGEPLMHDLTDLVQLARSRNITVHLETSGTIRLPILTMWVTVSPKQEALEEVIERASELKLLVDKDFNPGTLSPAMMRHGLVYLQPINYEKEICQKNVDKCLGLLRQFPQWRLSLQIHKMIGQR